MARLLVFVSELGDLIANTEPVWADIRWGIDADCDALIAAGVSTNWLNWALDHGARFVVAEENGRIIGHNIFLSYESVWQYDWLLVRLDPKQDVLSTASFVVPERRRRRVFVSIKRFAAEYFAHQGYRRIISLVEAGNEPSIRAHRRIGAVCRTTLTRARIGKLKLVWQGAELRHFGWGPEPFVFGCGTASQRDGAVA
jgi:L-amino acid N-acyltransferase YncA